ncbi:hypothetical protein N7470_004720 [Penicillium chermesinum]|nr:hypothetical protein N7470_004720 [Penicillium chermesinum]
MSPQGDRGGIPWMRFFQEVGMMIATGVVAYGGVRLVLNHLMPPDAESQKKEEQRQKSQAILRRLYGGEESKDGATKSELVLNQYEQVIAQELIDPRDINVRWADIAGLDDTLQQLKCRLNAWGRSVWRPLEGSSWLRKDYNRKGAGRRKRCFIHQLEYLHLTEKWYGDSNKLVKAVFTLARKVQPCIVFIDEIDAILGNRMSGGEHEASGMVKAEFMTHWQGLDSSNEAGEPQRIVVLGATNRPNSRSLPDAKGRYKLFKLFLKGRRVDWEDLELEEDEEELAQMTERDVMMKRLIRKTQGCSGSFIKEACRSAIHDCTCEGIEEMQRKGVNMHEMSSTHVQRPLRLVDFAPKQSKDSMDSKSCKIDGLFDPEPAPRSRATSRSGEDEREWRTESETPETYSARAESPE